jgi:hypothetical protein
MYYYVDFVALGQLITGQFMPGLFITTLLITRPYLWPDNLASSILANSNVFSGEQGFAMDRGVQSSNKLS